MFFGLTRNILCFDETKGVPTPNRTFVPEIGGVKESLSRSYSFIRYASKIIDMD